MVRKRSKFYIEGFRKKEKRFKITAKKSRGKIEIHRKKSDKEVKEKNRIGNREKRFSRHQNRIWFTKSRQRIQAKYITYIYKRYLHL